MATQSKIEWTDHTFNPWRGCTRVSEGYKFCYADLKARWNPRGMGKWGKDGERVVGTDDYWRVPVKWNKAAAQVGVRRRVFCASLADVFEGAKSMPKEDRANVVAARARLFNLIAATPSLDWQLLTKRPENIETLWPQGLTVAPPMVKRGRQKVWGNVWLGTSVESRKVLHRIDTLRKIPAAIRFLSIEPLLESLGKINLKGIDWVIVGGESGALANVRPFHVEWAEEIMAQCRAAGVPCFLKQLGRKACVGLDEDLASWPVETEPLKVGPRVDLTVSGRRLQLVDLKGGQWEEWPERLRVREYPRPVLGPLGEVLVEQVAG